LNGWHAAIWLSWQINVSNIPKRARLKCYYIDSHGQGLTVAGLILTTDNEARAMRVAEIITDFRNLQYYLATLQASPSAEDYYLEGYVLLRACVAEGQSVLASPYEHTSQHPSGDPEHEKSQLRLYVALLFPFRPRPFTQQTILRRTDHDKNHPRCEHSAIPMPESVHASTGCAEMVKRKGGHSSRTKAAFRKCGPAPSARCPFASGKCRVSI
jgi:hypothetical protein